MSDPEEGTIRERIVRLLSSAEYPMSAAEIARELGLPPGEVRSVYAHLEHVAKTLNGMYGGSLVLLMEPPHCRKCGYVFKSLKKPRKPSRCPKCGSEWIEPPRFIIGQP